MRRIVLLCAASLVLASPAVAAPPGSNTQVCPPLDTGKIDTVGDPSTVTVTAPAGYAIDLICVKAGSAVQGDGPEYITPAPLTTSLTFGHSTGKDVSHWSARFVALPTEPPTPPTEPPTPPTEPPTPPTEPPTPPTEPPTEPQDPPTPPTEPPVPPTEPPVLPQDPPVLPQDPPVVSEAPPVLPQEPPAVPGEPPAAPQIPVTPVPVVTPAATPVTPAPSATPVTEAPRFTG